VVVVVMMMVTAVVLVRRRRRHRDERGRTECQQSDRQPQPECLPTQCSPFSLWSRLP
jgi:hypothetical protein